MVIKENIKKQIEKSVHDLFNVQVENVLLEHPADVNNGDFSTNIAMVLVKEVGKSPRGIAEMVKINIEESGLDGVEETEVAGPGFINFYLSQDFLVSQIDLINERKEAFGENSSMESQRIMVEFAHPNTHKEMHIGHMRTLIVGESLARILEAAGGDVFRANYQGDIGPHVAKAIWGTQKILEERNMTLDQAEKELTNSEKADLVGEGYVRGNQEYNEFEKEIKELNKDLYKGKQEVMPIYQRTRQWSLDYYDELYDRFGTSFDNFFMIIRFYQFLPPLKSEMKKFHPFEGATL